MEEKKDNEHGNILIEWSFPELPRHKRGMMWYFFSGLVLVLFLGYAIAAANYLFALIIALFAILFYTLNKSIRDIIIKISEDGITVGKKFHSYSDIEKFWIIYHPPEVKTLYIDLKSIFIPHLIISLEEKNPNEVRGALSQYLPEDVSKEEEPAIDTLTRKLKL